eukprot:scaffold30538_cov69-Phaeocystis_antarctica.AAC.1
MLYAGRHRRSTIGGSESRGSRSQSAFQSWLSLSWPVRTSGRHPVVVASSIFLTGFPCKSELIGSHLALLPGRDLFRVVALGRDCGIQTNKGFWRRRDGAPGRIRRGKSTRENLQVAELAVEPGVRPVVIVGCRSRHSELQVPRNGNVGIARGERVAAVFHAILEEADLGLRLPQDQRVPCASGPRAGAVQVNGAASSAGCHLRVETDLAKVDTIGRTQPVQNDRPSRIVDQVWVLRGRPAIGLELKAQRELRHVKGRRGQRVDLHLREHEVPPGSESCSHWWASARQLHPNVPRQLRAVAEQRANRICRSRRLGADRPRVCGADA